MRLDAVAATSCESGVEARNVGVEHPSGGSDSYRQTLGLSSARVPRRPCPGRCAADAPVWKLTRRCSTGLAGIFWLKGHWVMLMIGLTLRLFWIIGALSP